MIGPWHVDFLDGAIDRRQRRRHRLQPRRPGDLHRGRAVDTWHTHIPAGPQVLWPPIHPDDQPEYARRVVHAHHTAGALVTVIHRNGATCLLVIDVFGVELTDRQQQEVRSALRSLRPPPFFRIRPWVADKVGPPGRFHHQRCRER